MELPGTGTLDTVGARHDESKKAMPTNEIKRPALIEIFLVVAIT
jgi:hypothetical protein